MLAVNKLSKGYGDFALQDISFDLAEGEVVALLGPSGSGKSSLLNLVAGLELPDEGSISWRGRDLAAVPAHKRGFGLMFQDFALFPHRDVFGNVAFGLQMADLPGEDIQARVEAMLELVGLPGFAGREVSRLSGGEQQRVALARALAPRPRLLMLDEPLGALDRTLRQRLLEDLARILRQGGQTSLYVTHDQEEAYAIADRIVLLHAGRVAQIGAPEAIYARPASPFVARFLGLENLLEAQVLAEDGQIWLQTLIGKFPSPIPNPQSPVTILLRPDAVQLGDSAAVVLGGPLRARRFRGNTVWAEVEVKGQILAFEFLSQTALPKIGDTLTISFDPQEAIQVLPDEA